MEQPRPRHPYGHDARQDAGLPNDIVLRVDGGMTASTWTMRFLADMLSVGVNRPCYLETTALGAGYLAGLDAGLYPEPAGLQKRCVRDRRFTPLLAEAERARKWSGWQTSGTQPLHQG